MISVLIVDDSAVARASLSAMFVAPEFSVDTALDAIFALGKMERRWPDVVVLDLELPRLDGLGFLKKVMAERPTPIVVCSGLTERGTQTSMAALAAGALAVVPKTILRPDADQGELVRLVREAAAARPGPVARASPPGAPLAKVRTRTVDLIALGTSTGGPQSLETVLASLEPDCPPVVVVQHMPEHFTRAFAARLDGLCRVTVREAAGGEPLTRGTCFIAPGGRHLEVRRVQGQLVTQVLDAPPVNRHCPSVDVLFRSLTKLGDLAIAAALMTGMGDDGARGLLELRRAGATTYAQDEQSCIVYGMPREAVRLGAAQASVPLGALAHVLQGFSPA